MKRKSENKVTYCVDNVLYGFFFSLPEKKETERKLLRCPVPDDSQHIILVTEKTLTTQ